MRARYYNPKNGRFTQEDPIRDGYNFYTYCVNNPVRYIDSTGLWFKSISEEMDTYKRLRETGMLKAIFSSFDDFKATYGFMVQAFADAKGINVNFLYAFLSIETRHTGSGFFPDGRLFIQFEPDEFRKRTGYSLPNDLVLDPYDADSVYAVFEWAKKMDEYAAYMSISMGVGQIMGFNYADAGYDSAKEMYDDFCTGYIAQLYGFFNYIINYDEGSILSSLQNGNFEAAVTSYNGTPTYNDNLKTFCRIAGVEVPQWYKEYADKKYGD